MKLLTIQDVCRRFSITRNTLLNWRTKHNFPEIRISGNKQDSIRFDEEQITMWATQNPKRVKNDASRSRSGS